MIHKNLSALLVMFVYLVCLMETHNYTKVLR